MVSVQCTLHSCFNLYFIEGKVLACIVYCVPQLMKHSRFISLFISYMSSTSLRACIFECIEWKIFHLNFDPTLGDGQKQIHPNRKQKKGVYLSKLIDSLYFVFSLAKIDESATKWIDCMRKFVFLFFECLLIFQLIESVNFVALLPLLHGQKSTQMNLWSHM